MLKSSNFPSKAEVINTFKNYQRPRGVLQAGILLKRTNGWKEFNKHSALKTLHKLTKEINVTLGVSHLSNDGIAKAYWSGEANTSLGS